MPKSLNNRKNDQVTKENLRNSSLNRLQVVTLSAAYNIALQISLRVVTFVSNAFIIRYISKDILGLINVKLFLLYTTIQFLSREAIRRTCASKTKNGDSKTQTEENIQWKDIVNITSLTVPISLVIGFFFSSLWLWPKFGEQPEEGIVFHYQYGIASVYASVIIEMLAEPCFIYGQRNDFIRLRVVIEGIFQLVRCLVIAATVFYSPQNAILGFAFAQLIASTVYSCCYYSYFLQIDGQTLSNFMPSMKKKPLFDPTLLWTSVSFFWNTMFKQFLTEGERYVMTIFAVIGLAEQGVYDAINNLGSLPARLVFQPIEESAYYLFSNLVKREVPPNKQTSQITESLNICSNLVRFMLLLGLTIFTYGHNCAKLALFIYGGRDLISGHYGHLAVRLLQWHCFYVFFIALNGILESYSFAVMSVRELNKFNYKMLLLSASFLLISLATTSWFGSEGFIIANCVNMFLRIVISFCFIGKINTTSSTWTFIQQCCPDLITLSSFAVVFAFVSNIRSIILKDSLTTGSSAVWHASSVFVVLTGITLLVHMCIIYYRQKDLVYFVRTRLLSRRRLESKTKIS